VNDAFAVSHRKNASLVAITKMLPSCAGLLMETEVVNLDTALYAHEHPFVLILGGVKMTDKMGLIKQFINKADYLLAGGGIANTMFAADGLPIGDSVYEKSMIPFAKKIMKTNKVIVPMDVVISERKIVDNGEGTTEEWMEIIKSAKTIIWNGPLGVIEDKRFAKGSVDIAKAIAKSKAFSVVGGGETALAFRGVPLKKNTFLSTGGGAMLEYLSGIKLPGIEVLRVTQGKGKKK
jgi:phosphoglycerate kinase